MNPERDRAIDGRQIGPYRLLDVLGEGGMGVVYRAEQTSPVQRQVALKLVPLGMDTARVVARFESERQALALMNHPYIAQVLDAAAEDGRPYFVMELVHGEPVTDYCARETPSLAVRLKLFLQICEAIEHAHQRGIIHRDLKPSNVLLAKQGSELVPKIIDFGIAKAVGEAEGKLFLSTMEGQIMGTPEDMSPEQAGVIDAGLDTRTDVYSLGVMLYELVSGRRPYELKKRTALELDRVMRTPPVPPSQVGRTEKKPKAENQKLNLQRSTARDIDAVALMAMERMPDDRYASVAQLAGDVRRVLEHRPVRARTQTWTYRAQKFLRRNAASVATAALVVVLIATGAIGIIDQRNRAIASELRAVSEATRARAEGDKASQVSLFLIDLFRESDPANARGASVTARELLDRGAQRLSTELASQEVVRATLMDTIGVVYRALGLIDESEQITTDALAIRRRAVGSEHPDVAQSLDHLGQLARDRSHYEEAAQFHRDALAMQRKLLAAKDPAIAESLNNLGLALSDLGKYDDAVPLVEEAIAIRRETVGPEHSDTLTSLKALGSIRDNTGKFADAERLYGEVLSIRRRLLPADHPLVAGSIEDLAGVLSRDGKLAEAETMFREALEIRRKVLAPDHPDLTATKVSLSRTLRNQGRLDEAEPLMRDALAADRRHFGNKHMTVAVDLNYMAAILQDRGKFDEAGTLFEESKEIRIALVGEVHPLVAVAQHNLGNLRLKQSKWDEAERALRRAIEIRNALGQQKHRQTGETVRMLGRVFEGRGKFAEAETQDRAGLAILREASPGGSPSTADALESLGYLKVRQKQASTGEPLIREALEFRRKSLPAGHRAITLDEVDLGECLVAQSKWAEAETLLLSALTKLPEDPTTPSGTRKRALEQLAALYENTGKPDEAAKYARNFQRSNRDMTPERFELVKRMLADLEELPASGQAAYLDRACAGDDELREDVESLMSHDFPSIMRTGGLAAKVAPMMADDRAALGRQIGLYRLLDVLGEGGMGVVYRAEQTSPIQREVALKLVPFGMDTARVISRFESERQALALMNHPYIAQALDAAAGEDGRPYFVMELVHGEPVTDYCAREKPSLAVRLKLFLQICEAIQHAHQRGIIHRDLKPSNVLLTKQGAEIVPKIIDFGIAKAIGDAESRMFLSTAEGQIMGTPEYMSPEQAGVIDAGLDTRTDVYSLGVMLYELVSGQRPYKLKKRTAIELERALRTPPVPPSQVGRTGVKPKGKSQKLNNLQRSTERDIDAVALMAMERMPDDRYASVEQLADDVRSVLEHRPVRARTQTWTYRAQKFVRRNAASVATAALVVVLIVTGAIGIVGQRNRAIASELRAVSEATRARAEADKASEVSRFLIDLFRESDPANARGASVTARELLERGAQRLNTGLASQEAVRATLMDTIGVVYRALGMIDDAEKISADSLVIRRKALGPEHPDVAQSLDNLGQLARERSRYEQAVQYHREALAIRRKVLEPRDAAIGESASNLALALRERGNYDEARPLAQEALSIRREKLGPEDNATLASMNVLGDIESSSGHRDEAERLYREVLEIRRRVLPPNHPRLAVSLNNVAGVLQGAGRLEEAEALFREALAIRRKILPPDHADLTTSEANLGALLQTLGRLDEAEPLLREALASDRRRAGNQHMDVALDLADLGSLLEDRGKLQEAGALYEESLAIRIALQGAQHPSVANVLTSIGRLRFVQRALDASERAYRRAMDIRTALHMEANPRHADTVVSLGRVLEARGQRNEAGRLYTSGLAIHRAASPKGSPGTANALTNLGHWMLVNKDVAGAEPLLREALSYRRQSLPAGHATIATAEAALADCLLQQSKWPEAETLLLSAVKTAPAGPTSALYSRKDALQLLVTLYEKTGRPEDAAMYRAQLRASQQDPA